MQENVSSDIRFFVGIQYANAAPTNAHRFLRLLFCACLLLLVALQCRPLRAEDRTPENALAEALSAANDLASDKPDNALSTLKKLTDARDKSAAYRASAELAAYYRTKGDLKKAAGYTADFQNPVGFKELHPAVAAQYLRGVLEAAHVLVLTNNEPRALQLLSWAEGLEDPFNKALAQTKYAEILLGIDEFDRCRSYLENAAKAYVGRAKDKSDNASAIGQASVQVSTASPWEEIKTRTDLLRIKLKQKELEKKFGKDYGLYAYMRLSLENKNYAEAKKTAKEIIEGQPKSIFVPAAKYTYGCCLLRDEKSEPAELKRIKAAEEWYAPFLKEDPQGLYRGETYLLMGAEYMEKLWDADEAFRCYSKALECFVAARQRANELSLYAPLNDDVRTFVAPTKELTTYDGFMRTVYNDEDPLKMYSTATTPPWYTNEKEKQCHYALGFILFSQDDYEKARDHWSKILSLDPTMQRMDPKWFPSAHTRLMNACRDKQITFSKSEKADIKDKNERLKILFGEYLYYLERFGESIDQFDEIARKTPNRYTRLIALMGKGLAQDMGSGPPNSGAPSTKEDARQTYLLILKDYKDMKMTKIYARATFDFCASLMGYGAKQHEVPPLITEYLQLYPENKLCTKDEARNAEYWLVFVYASLGDHDKFRALLKKFDLTIKDGRTESLLSELEVIEEREKKKREEEKTAKDASEKK